MNTLYYGDYLKILRDFRLAVTNKWANLRTNSRVLGSIGE